MGTWDDIKSGLLSLDVGGLGNSINGTDAKAAAQQQYDAQANALAQQQALAAQMTARGDVGIGQIGAAGGVAQGYLSEGNQAAQNAFSGALEHGLGAYGQGRDQSLGALLSGYGQAAGYMGQGYGQARSDLSGLAALQGYGSDATRSINPYDVTGRIPGSLADVASQQQARGFGGFEADPGYQFRLQQGQNAIMNQASASGGRGSARTMQALSDYNQGQASQEYGNYTNRVMAMNQQQLGAAGQVDQTRLQAYLNQAGRSDAAGLQAQQNQYGLAGMGYGAQNSLANLASQFGQQQGAMAYGYGSQASGIQGQYGQNLADLYGQYGQQQAGQANMYGSQSAGLATSTAQAQANIGIGVGTGNQSALGSAYDKFAQYGGMQQQAAANQQQQQLGLIASIFSDARLKKDISTISGSRYEGIGIRGVRWTWNHRGEALGLRGVSEGVIAQEVALKYPQAVGLRGDWLVVDYGALEQLLAEAA